MSLSRCDTHMALCLVTFAINSSDLNFITESFQMIFQAENTRVHLYAEYKMIYPPKSFLHLALCVDKSLFIVHYSYPVNT